MTGAGCLVVLVAFNARLVDMFSDLISGNAGQIHEGIAAEMDLSAAYALSMNTRCKHIFQDAKALVKDGKRSFFAYCYLHGSKCRIPEDEIDLFVSGFSCKANSTQNSERWVADPTQSEHFESFLSCVDFVALFQPKMVVLENVRGLTMPVAKGSKSTVLDAVMAKLRQLTGYQWKHYLVDAAVLPDARKRIYFVGTRLL